jgi:xylulose-5-phosphate/fructose-6-phosphate phosphoketolase
VDNLPGYVTSELLESMAKYLRLTNYIAASELYLRDNFLLESELKPEHIKRRVLGHWGTVPGLNFIYLCLNILIKQYQQEMMLIVGPGHGYPSLLANLFIEGSMGEFYPELKFSKKGFGKLIHDFSWPGGFPSHANPETPGVILEGGELGYSLATAFGSAFDNPDLIVTCVVGDGESETGPTATAWHSIKFMNPKTDGAVLPILHLNKFKISGPTLTGTMDDQELIDLYRGYGYDPVVVEGEFLYEPMLKALDDSYHKIKELQRMAREENKMDKPRWPMIVLRSKKGWTGPKEYKGLPIEDSFRSHGIPLEHTDSDPGEFELLKNWLASYNVNELFTSKFELLPEIKALVPPAELRMGMSKDANGFNLREFKYPDLKQFEIKFARSAGVSLSNMQELSKYMAEFVRLNPDSFRIMSPDETESNKLHELFKVTTRRYIWPIPFGSENLSPDGRVMEILSEHSLVGWLEGYVLTGRNGVFISYEAFVMIVASMVDQYTKFLKQKTKISWRKDVPSLNIILTSESWRQDHNGYSHQNPGFISSVLNDYSNTTDVYFPVDANTLLLVMEKSLKSVNGVNVIVAGKREMPQYLTMEQARDQISAGVMRWDWMGNDSENPDIVFTASGDNGTKESIAAIDILKEVCPDLKTRFVSITELTCFGIGDNCNLCKISMDHFQHLFTADKHIIYSHHGYPEDIQHLIYNHPAATRFHIHGYRERGTTTTPFNMLVLNKCDRYNLCLDAIKYASQSNKQLAAKRPELEAHFNSLLEKHERYIKENGDDMPEVTGFKY